MADNGTLSYATLTNQNAITVNGQQIYDRSAYLSDNQRAALNARTYDEANKYGYSLQNQNQLYQLQGNLESLGTQYRTSAIKAAQGVGEPKSPTLVTAPTTTTTSTPQPYLTKEVNFTSGYSGFGNDLVKNRMTNATAGSNSGGPSFVTQRAGVEQDVLSTDDFSKNDSIPFAMTYGTNTGGPNFSGVDGKQYQVTNTIGVDLFNPDNRALLQKNIQGGLYTTAGDALTGKVNPVYEAQYGYSTNKGLSPYGIAPITFTPIPKADQQAFALRQEGINALGFLRSTSPFGAVDKFLVSDTQAYNALPSFLQSKERFTYANPLGTADMPNPYNYGFTLNPVKAGLQGQGLAVSTTFNVLRGVADIPKDVVNTPLVFGKELEIGAGIGLLTGGVAGGFTSYAERKGFGTAAKSGGEAALTALGTATTVINPYGTGRNLPATAAGIGGFKAGFESIAPTKVEFLGITKGEIEPRINVNDNTIGGVGLGTAKVRTTVFGVDKGISEIPTGIQLSGQRAANNVFLTDINAQGLASVNNRNIVFSQDYTGALRINPKSSVLSVISGDKETIFLSATTKVKTNPLDIVEQGKKPVYFESIEGVASKSATLTRNPSGVYEVTSVGKTKSIVQPLVYNKQQAFGIIEDNPILYSRNLGVTQTSSAGGVSLRFANRGFNLLASSGRYTEPSIIKLSSTSVFESRKGMLSFGDTTTQQGTSTGFRGGVLGTPATVSVEGLPVGTSTSISSGYTFLSVPRSYEPQGFRTNNPRELNTFSMPVTSFVPTTKIYRTTPSIDTIPTTIKIPRTDTTPVFSTSIARITDTVPQQDFIQTTNPAITPLPSFVGFPSTPPPTPAPVIIPNIVFGPSGPSGVFGTGRKQKYKYAPSLTATVFNIRGKQPKRALGGFEVRPLTRKGVF